MSKRWIWEFDGYPNFTYDRKELDSLIEDIIFLQGSLSSTVSFVSKEILEELKKIEIDINKRILPLFMELTEQFTQYSLKEFLSLNSKHSKRIYQLLKQYENIGERTINIDDLKKFLEIENNKSYNRFYNFEKRVLETTKNDINSLTNLNINFEKEKQGKEVVAVTFKMKKNTV